MALQPVSYIVEMFVAKTLQRCVWQGCSARMLDTQVHTLASKTPITPPLQWKDPSTSPQTFPLQMLILSV